jgi:DNA-binding NarL/FixJ family response regulator
MYLTAIELIRQRFETLSPRQKAISLLLGEGLTNSDIAENIGVTVHTVKAHRAEVMRRMGVDSFAELVRQLQRLQYLGNRQEQLDRDPIRVIVVEDDEWYRDYLTDNLLERGFAAVGVADGPGFEAAWAERAADIVVLDIELGSDKENGLTIATRLLASHGCGVIMVTGRGAQDDRLKGLSIGVDAYFAKPVNIEELAITLTNLWRRLG